MRDEIRFVRRHCERSEAIQRAPAGAPFKKCFLSGALRARLDCFVAALLAMTTAIQAHLITR
jgi:hypothetical protein